VRVAGVLRYDFRIISGGADEARAISGFYFYVIDKCAHGEFAKRKSVPDCHSGRLGDNECVADFYFRRQNDVALCAVGIYGKPDERGAERVVFNRGNFGLYIFLVKNEVHHAVAALVAAPFVARGYTALIISPHSALVTAYERFRRLVPWKKFVVIKARHSAGPRRSWFVDF